METAAVSLRSATSARCVLMSMAPRVASCDGVFASQRDALRKFRSNCIGNVREERAKSRVYAREYNVSRSTTFVSVWITWRYGTSVDIHWKPWKWLPMLEMNVSGTCANQRRPDMSAQRHVPSSGEARATPPTPPHRTVRNTIQQQRARALSRQPSGLAGVGGVVVRSVGRGVGK